MKVMLLAAGVGSRLRPITDNTPKCLVSIADNKPLLEIWLEQLAALEVSQILINTSYLAEQVENYVRSSRFRNKISLSYEPELLGTAGTLRANRDFWRNQDLLLAHADNLCVCNWQGFIERFKSKPSYCVGTMMLFESDNPQSCGIVDTNQSGVLTEFHEKVSHPPSNRANAAIYLFGKELVNWVDRLDKSDQDISLHLLPKLINRMNVWQIEGYLRDIGTPESLEIARADYRNFVTLP
jgi:mannose-1-phosphate guanylyltransferase